MAHFYFREIAINQLNNRGLYLPSKEVISKPFLKENRLKEIWRGMYMFKTDKPEEGDASFGDFYMEIDETDFYTLKSMTLTIVDYLFDNFKLNYSHVNFFMTNRSIWISIPTKVFNCFGTRNLHKIHKLMAEEVHYHLLSKGYKKGLDLSIYRWNGLMRCLGSYLPKTKRWVTKFNLSDLEDSNSMDDLFRSKYDNGFTYQDIDAVEEAAEWFYKHYQEINNNRYKKKKDSKTKKYIHKGMEDFIDRGELSFNRNLHIYSISLYLKNKGLTEDEAIDLIHNKFNNSYVKTKEALRTIHSAFKGNKRFSPKTAQSFLDESIFDDTQIEKSSFIIPRVFIEKLHDKKLHYKSYKYLFTIMHEHQIYGKPFYLDLSKNKYKKREEGHFKKLQLLGFISYVIKDDMLVAEFTHQSSELFQSHIVIPKGFVETRRFKKMKREFIVLSEIWRSSIKTSDTKYMFYFNLKEETIGNNVRMLKHTVRRYISILRKDRIIIGNFFLPNRDKSLARNLVRSIVERNLDSINTKRVVTINSIIRSSFIPYLPFVVPAFSLIIKCNYSRLDRLLTKTNGINRFSPSTCKLLWEN